MVRVLKNKILLISLSIVVFSFISCKNNLTEVDLHTQEIERAVNHINEFYSTGVPDGGILVLNVKDSIDLFNISLDRIPDKTKISVCFSDDSAEFYLNHNPYSDYSLFIDDLKGLILNKGDSGNFENNTVSLFISPKSIENRMLSLLKEIYRYKYEIGENTGVEQNRSIYIFIFASNTVECLPLPPLPM